MSVGTSNHSISVSGDAPDQLIGEPLIWPNPSLRVALDEKRGCDWSAQWIWSKHGNVINQYIYARRGFSIDGTPDSAILHISADLRYKLYINGGWAGYGPPLDSGGFITSDSYDVARLLKPGANVIAVVVHTALRQRGGLICQLESEIGGKRQLVMTDRSWKIRLSEAWDVDTPPFASPMSGWFTEIHDSRKAPNGWLDAEYNDSSWEDAWIMEAGDSCGGVGRGACDREIEASEIPFSEVKEILPLGIEGFGEVMEIDGRRGETSLTTRHGNCRLEKPGNISTQMSAEVMRPLRRTSIERAENLLSGEACPCIVDNHEITTASAFNNYWRENNAPPEVHHATIILDFGDFLNGWYVIDVTGDRGAIVDVAWVPALFDGRVVPDMSNSYHANRHVLRGGREELTSFNWMHFRYLQITFRDLDNPLQIHRVVARKISYPFQQVGSFDCSDQLITKIWDASVKTMELSTVDNYYLDMFREVRIYADYPQSGMLAVLAAFGNPEVSRRFVKLLSRHKDERGFFLGVMEDHGSPFSYEQCQHVATLIAFALYYWNDPEQVRILYPHLVDYIHLNEQFLGTEGVLENARLGSFGSFLDWGGGHATEGAVALPQNLTFCQILEQAEAIAECNGFIEDAQYFHQMAEPVREYLFQHSWDDERGVYVTNVTHGELESTGWISEHANYAALWLGLGKDGRKERVLKVLRERPDEVNYVEPMYTLVPMQALFRIGEAEMALDFMRDRLGRAFINGFDTFPEEWSPFATFRERNRLTPRVRGLVYSSASVAAHVLSSEVLGIKPTTPGFATFGVNPQWGNLIYAKGVVPSPKGAIAVSWKKVDMNYSLEVAIPPETVATIHMPEGRDLRIDGVVVDTAALSNRRNVAGEIIFEIGGAGNHRFEVALFNFRVCEPKDATTAVVKKRLK